MARCFCGRRAVEHDQAARHQDQLDELFAHENAVLLGQAAPAREDGRLGDPPEQPGDHFLHERTTELTGFFSVHREPPRQSFDFLAVWSRQRKNALVRDVVWLCRFR